MDTDFSFLDGLAEDTKDKLKRSTLECSLLFHSNNVQAYGIEKGDIFVKSIFALIVGCGQQVSTQGIAQLYHERFKKEIDLQVLQLSLDKLVQYDWISLESDKTYRPHKRAAKLMREGTQQFEDKVKVLIQQLTEGALSRIDIPVSDEIRLIIERNFKKSLNLYIQLNVIDFIIDENEIENKLDEEDVVGEIKRDLSSEISDALLESFSNVIEHPTAEQKQTLLLCLRLFVGAQIMQVDPIVSQTELSKLKEKRFILDTDFILYSITRHCKQSGEYKKLLKTLRKIGCELIIPNEVVEEVMKHAMCAESNYNRFKNTLQSIDEEVIEQTANNVFVKDYCLNVIRNSYSKSLHTYLYNNYISDEDPLEFVKDFIFEELHIEAGLQYPIPVDQEYLYIKDQLVDKIYEKTRNSDKDRWRDDNETRNIADTDAKLLLNTLALNKEIKPAPNKDLFYANTYLVTYTTKGIKSAKELNIYKKVVTRPEILINLLSEIGVFDEESDGAFNLFDNPFLAHIMSEHWDMVRTLSEAGVDLREKSVPKLKRDLEATVHIYLTENSDIEKIDATSQKTYQSISIDNYIAFAKEIKNKNYKLVPDAQQIIDAFEDEKKKTANAEAKAANSEALLKKKTSGYQEYMRTLEQNGTKNNKTRSKSRKKQLEKVLKEKRK